MAEGGGLLNRYTLSRRIEGSNPSVSAIKSPARAEFFTEAEGRAEPSMLLHSARLPSAARGMNTALRRRAFWVRIPPSPPLKAPRERGFLMARRDGRPLDVVAFRTRHSARDIPHETARKAAFGSVRACLQQRAQCIRPCSRASRCVPVPCTMYRARTVHNV